MKEKILTRLQEHYNEVKKFCDEEQILGVFLYGSQNYGVDNKDSDVDSVAIIIPTIKDMVLNEPLSIEIQFDNGEHCVVKDLREMLKMWKKQNINFLEVLYTQYYIVNPNLALFYVHLLAVRECFVHYDIEKMVKSICGQAIHTLKQNPADPKKLSNAMRLYDFIIDFCDGANYQNCLYPSEDKRVKYKRVKYGATTTEQNQYLYELTMSNLIELQTHIPHTDLHKKDCIEIVIDNTVISIIKTFNQEEK